MPHHLTIDVEDHLHTSAMEPYLGGQDPDEVRWRSPSRTMELLDLLGERDIRATFFVLGRFARKEPAVVRRIAADGHEVAAHGWSHRRIGSLSPGGLRGELRDTRDRIEDLTGTRVDGFRAPSFSIVPGLEWALEVLVEEGYRYDSSLFPIRGHPTYGYPCPAEPHRIPLAAGELVEFPPTTTRILGRNLPAAGGAWLRFLPLAFIRRGLREAEAKGISGTLYLHPWELDPELPVGDLPLPVRVRMSFGNGSTRARLEHLLGAFEFEPIRCHPLLSGALGAGALEG